MRPLLIAGLLGLAFSAACATPNRIAPSYPGSYLVVLEKQDGKAAVIEPNSGWVKNRYTTGVGPHEVAVTGNGQYAVVSNYGDQGTQGHTLTVLNLLQRREESTIELGEGERPHGIAFLDMRSTVLVTSESSSSVLQVSVPKMKVERRIPTGAKGTHMLALSPDRKRAYTANVGSGTVSVLDLEKGVLMQQVEVGRQPEGIAVGRDGRIWVGLNDEAKVVVIDPNTLTVTGSVADLPFPIRVKVTYDNKLAVVSCAGSGEVVLIDAQTLQVVTRIPMDKLDPAPADSPPGMTPGSPVPVGIVIGPESKLAFVALTAANKVAVIDLKEHVVRGYYATGNAPDGMAWSYHVGDPNGNVFDGVDF